MAHLESEEYFHGIATLDKNKIQLAYLSGRNDLGKFEVFNVKTRKKIGSFTHFQFWRHKELSKYYVENGNTISLEVILFEISTREKKGIHVKWSEQPPEYIESYKEMFKNLSTEEQKKHVQSQRLMDSKRRKK